MPISAYSPIRDNNALIAPGDIRSPDFARDQQMINSIRQLMADLAGLGITPFIEGLLNDANAAAALTTLGVSTYIQTLLDDADAIAARSTLGVSHWEAIGAPVDTVGVASVIWTDLSPYRKLRLSGQLTPVTNSVNLTFVYSEDNGSTYKTGAADYFYVFNQVSHTGVFAGGNASAAALPLASGTVVNTTGCSFFYELNDFNQAKIGIGQGLTFNLGAAVHFLTSWGGMMSRTVARDALKINFSSGNIATGYVALEGIRG